AVLADDGREVAELSLDAVRLPQSGYPQVRYELEIELRPDGTRQDLKSLEKALAAYRLTPQGQSKFERALALVEGQQPGQPAGLGPEKAEAAANPPRAKPVGVRADEPMAEAGRKVLRFHYARMINQEEGVRQGADIEAVHDMRVATRRQRAALGLFAGHF